MSAASALEMAQVAELPSDRAAAKTHLAISEKTPSAACTERRRTFVMDYSGGCLTRRQVNIQKLIRAFGVRKHVL